MTKKGSRLFDESGGGKPAKVRSGKSEKLKSTPYTDGDSVHVESSNVKSATCTPSENAEGGERRLKSLGPQRNGRYLTVTENVKYYVCTTTR